MNAGQILLILAWIVLGIGGGAVCGWSLQMRKWPLAVVGGIAMVIGISAGLAVQL